LKLSNSELLYTISFSWFRLNGGGWWQRWWPVTEVVVADEKERGSGGR